MTKRNPKPVAPHPQGEAVVDLASFVASAVPWIGGPVSNVLSGMSFGRKLARVREVVEGMAVELREFESTAAEQFVATEDFEDLLEETLHRVAKERSAEKRKVFRQFLVHAISSPGTSYDEQLRFLRILEEMQEDHLRILRALDESPDYDAYSITGSPLQTLMRRIRDMSEDHIEELVRDLTGWRVTEAISLKTMMTPQGAEELAGLVTPLGRRFLRYLLEDQAE